MKEAGRQEHCEKCNAMLNRAYQDENKSMLGTQRGETFWSQAMAISPSQAEEHRRLFPNVRVRSDGCIGFDSVKDRSDYCDRTGFYKTPGKKKRRETKIPVEKKSPPTPA
jgi:hypothetical protein